MAVTAEVYTQNPGAQAGDMAKGTRIDRLLVERGLVDSRTQAQGLILAGQVIVNDHVVDKAGAAVDPQAQIRIKGQRLPYVSRGGLKLRGALDAFEGLQVRDRVAMDVGASTGGFTDCLLQAGVTRVYAIDVGYGQLAWKLAQDPRIIVMDRTNIRHLQPDAIPEAIDLVVIDCSFISLTKVLPALPPFLAHGADLVALVKPQFEVGPERVGKGGIVRDADLHEEAFTLAAKAAAELGFDLRGRCDSPITGRDGNREFLLWGHFDGHGQSAPVSG